MNLSEILKSLYKLKSDSVQLWPSFPNKEIPKYEHQIEQKQIWLEAGLVFRWQYLNNLFFKEVLLSDGCIRDWNKLPKYFFMHNSKIYKN